MAVVKPLPKEHAAADVLPCDNLRQAFGRMHCLSWQASTHKEGSL